MERIASFCVDHNKLQPGLYVSRVDGDITTYDIRMRKPNCPPYLENAAIHTLEHLFATFARNSRWKDSVIYFGPMGCRTGFYFLARGMDKEDVLALARDIFAEIAAYEGEIPGTTAVECGNYREHDLTGAKREAALFLPVLQGWAPERFSYGI